MDQQQIGKFIATMRKEKKLTQRQIADRLEISDKAVSKWECGNGLPEMSYILPLCEILGVSANELLSGETISCEDYKEKAEQNMIKLVGEIEFEKKKYLVDKQYGITIKSVNKSGLGAGSLTYFVEDESGEQYVLKYPSENSMNHPEVEIQVCDYLLKKGMSVCEFVTNIYGSKLSTDEMGRTFTLQKRIPGICYAYSTAPGWLLPQMARTLGEIHRELKDYKGLSTGIGPDFFKYMKPENVIPSYENSMKLAQKQGKMDIVEDINKRLEIVKRMSVKHIDFNRLTVVNTHGDYMISQIICGEERINGVIDWTTVCRHPAVWEIARSYLFAAGSCEHGKIDIEEWKNYVEEYEKVMPLTDYDKEIMVYLFFYQLAVCDYFSQYFASMTENRYIYLKQAKLCTKLLVELEKLL